MHLSSARDLASQRRDAIKEAEEAAIRLREEEMKLERELQVVTPIEYDISGWEVLLLAPADSRRESGGHNGTNLLSHTPRLNTVIGSTHAAPAQATALNVCC